MALLMLSTSASSRPSSRSRSGPLFAQRGDGARLHHLEEIQLGRGASLGAMRHFHARLLRRHFGEGVGEIALAARRFERGGAGGRRRQQREGESGRNDQANEADKGDDKTLGHGGPLALTAMGRLPGRKGS